MKKYKHFWLCMAGWLISCGAAIGTTSEPAKEMPVMNSRVLRINYAATDTLKADGAEGQLWYRLNGGHWRKGITFKAGDPIEFTVSEEGVYDFAVEFGSDATATEPVANEGLFTCFVDYTPPLLQITDIRYGSGKFLVQWKAFDAHFSNRPIEIYLVNARETVLLGRFANTGAAVVKVDPKELPGKVKLVATDRAGNNSSELWKTEYRGPVVEEPKPVVTTKPASSQPIVKAVMEEEAFVQIPPAKRAVHAGDVKTAIREYKTGMEYQYRGQKDLAILHFKRAIDEAPEFVPSYIDLGSVLNKMERYNEAAPYFLQALSWDDKSVRAWKGLAVAKAKTFQYQQAKYCLEKVIALDKKDVEGWLLLGDAYWTIGQKVEARSAWFNARDLVGENEPREMKEAVDSRIRMIADDQGKK